MSSRFSGGAPRIFSAPRPVMPPTRLTCSASRWRAMRTSNHSVENGVELRSPQGLRCRAIKGYRVADLDHLRRPSARQERSLRQPGKARIDLVGRDLYRLECHLSVGLSKRGV